jgi:hypothetical protein
MRARYWFFRRRQFLATTGLLALLLLMLAPSLCAQQASPQSEAEHAASAPQPAVDSTETKPLAPPSLPEPKGALRLSPKYPVWIDPKEKAVLVDGQICLREGMLEMFACIRNTKEHEAIVSADTKAYLVHAGLLRLGAQVGRPVEFQPTYKPATGTEIEVFVRWKDAKGQMQTARAQDWVKDIRTQKAMTHPFVFAGSSFWTDPETQKQYYQAEGGDFVCVSNFGTAMLDIPVESTQSNEGLEFEAFTEKIPPLGAPVRLVFKPKLKEQGTASQPKGARAGAKHEASNAKSRAK